MVINLALFHANGPNTGSRAREMIAMSYRPAWCGPTVQDLDPWPDDVLASLPPAVRELCGNRNQRATHDQPGMPPIDPRTNAPGISPRRWNSP